MSSNLDIKKVYIDSRFKTANSKSDSDFYIELPRSFNVPEGVVAHIDDIVIPVSWSTVDERNQNCYIRVSSEGALLETSFSFDVKNYDGYQFATALNAKLTAAVSNFTPKPTFTTTYDHLENILVLTMTDSRSVKPFPIKLQIITDDTLKNGTSRLSAPNTINTIIRNTAERVITEATPYSCYLDLNQTRNLYLTSSALASYDTVSNFGIDTIIKKIPVNASYNRMIIHVAASGVDVLNVSKRTLKTIDFKLVDSSFRTVPLKDNHFSFSIIFQHKR